MFDEVFGPVSGRYDFQQVVMEQCAAFGVVGGQFGVTENRGQNVVKIMGNAAGQRPDCLYFLGLLQAYRQLFVLLFRILSFGNIAGGPQNRYHFAGAVMQKTGGHFNPDGGAILVVLFQFQDS